MIRPFFIENASSFDSFHECSIECVVVHYGMKMTQLFQEIYAFRETPEIGNSASLIHDNVARGMKVGALSDAISQLKCSLNSLRKGRVTCLVVSLCLWYNVIHSEDHIPLVSFAWHSVVNGYIQTIVLGLVRSAVSVCWFESKLCWVLKAKAVGTLALKYSCLLDLLVVNNTKQCPNVSHAVYLVQSFQKIRTLRKTHVALRSLRGHSLG